MSIQEFRYTICPVGNSSFLSANREEFLQAAFEKRGVKPTLLQSLPRDQWHVHFDYQDPALFREGGNIPPIWAKSNDADVVLIGLAFLPHRTFLLVRNDSNVDSVEQLRGLRLGVPVNADAIIDFYRATVEHGFETALAARGVAAAEVELTHLPANVSFSSGSPDHKGNLGQVEADALKAGKVDAIFAGGVFAQRLLATGEFKPIYELSADPELVLPINNSYPNTLTVSRQLAEEAPEIVVEYVKQTLLAAKWAQNHYPEVLELFTRQLHGTPGEVTTSLPINFHKHLAVNLSEQALLALEGQKRFLYDHGYLSKDFDLAKWADDRFLKAALAEIEQDA